MTGARWLMVVVLLGPLAVTPFGASQNLMEAKNAMFIHAGLGGALVAVQSWWVRAFLAWAWFAFIVSGMRGFAFLGLLGIIAWALLYQQARTLTKPEWHNVCRAVAVAAGFQIIWMLLQALGGDRLFVPIAWVGYVLPPDYTAPAQGWFGNPMDTAVFLGLSLPAVSAVHPLLALPTVIAILSLRSTAGFVCIVALALWAVLRGRSVWRWTIVPALAGLAAVQIVWLDPQGLGWRPLIWTIAATVAWQNPWAGWGPNALEHAVIIDSPVGRWNFVFNEWLQGWMELGVGAVLIALGYLVTQVLRLRTSWREAGILVPALGTLVALSTFSIPFRIGPVALLAALYLGRLDALREAT